jgi:hypothetical protein
LKPLELLRRSAGKSPRYLARRGFDELRRRVRSRRLRRDIEALTASDVAGRCGAASLPDLWSRRPFGVFRLSPADRDTIRALYAGPYAVEREALRRRVEKILSHEFDLLGSGPTALGTDIDWSRDFKSGRRWDLVPSETIDVAELSRESDVKVPWELSRCQHLTAFGRAWVVEGDPRLPAELEAQVRSWIGQNPAGLGVNWACAMDVALRAVSWICALGFFDGAQLSVGFREEMLLGLYRHGLWIAEHLEFGEVHGNHLLSDALGLVACGTVFRESEDGRSWLDVGSRLLEREILRQVEEDGVDIEASVAYHRLALEIFLVAARFLETAGLPPSSGYRARLEAMFDFVDAYVTPDGLSPVVGDADDGRALVLGETNIRDHRYLLSTGCAWLARGRWKRRAGKFWEDSLWLLGVEARSRFESLEDSGDESSHSFEVSGFFVLRSPVQYAFVDAGPVGFRGHGGHGHNDCLSFEWHAVGRPLLTDSGTYVYTASPEWRNRFRSTEFHNTIRVDRQEINRLPSPLALWSLSDDARPIGVRFSAGEERDVLEAGHSGYMRLADPVTVSRKFELDRRAPVLTLRDSLDGKKEHFVEFFFHAAPGAQALRSPDGDALFRWADGREVTIHQASGPQVAWEIRAGWFSPSYGVKMERPVWVASANAELPMVIDWMLTAGP